MINAGLGAAVRTAGETRAAFGVLVFFRAEQDVLEFAQKEDRVGAAAWKRADTNFSFIILIM